MVWTGVGSIKWTWAAVSEVVEEEAAVVEFVATLDGREIRSKVGQHRKCKT